MRRPEVEVAGGTEDLLAEGLGAAVEGAGAAAETEVGLILLGEALAVGSGAGVDAAAGDVAPGHSRSLAGLGDAAWEDGVAEETFRLLELAGIDIGFARVACGIDQEGGAVAAQGLDEELGLGVVQLCAGEIAEGETLAAKKCLVGLTHVTGTAEKIDHGPRE